MPDQVVEHIRDAIITNRFKGGERIVESRLAQDLGVGRSKVRQALWRLEQDGFVDIVPNVGAVVKELSVADMAHIYDLMGALEGLSMRVATPHVGQEDIARLERVVGDMEAAGDDRRAMFELNQEFHTLLAELGQNGRLIEFHRQLRIQTHRLVIHGLYNQVHARASIREHRGIVAAVRQGKGSTAATLLRKHYLASKERLIKYLNRSL